MAASQARLLAITARIHDVEYQAQSIQNAKVQLATQSDQVYNEYMDALDATSLTVRILGQDGSKSTVLANFNNLFSKNRVTPASMPTGSCYALRNENGKIVVEDDVYEAYENCKTKDAYAFAVMMTGGDKVLALGGNSSNTEGNEEDEFANQLKGVEENYYNEKGKDDNELKNLRDALQNYVGENRSIYDGSEVKEEDRKDYEALLNQYRDTLYRKHGEDILTATNVTTTPLMSKDEYNADLFNYYLSLFKQIQLAGGCVPISNYNGFFGDAANNSDWLQAMIESGKFTIEMVNTDKYGFVSFNTTSPSSDTNIGYTNTSSVDATAMKKAEAKYEKSLKEIDQKDKKYDLTLSKLETERTALTTEYESVKKVIEDNIDRTFGIFS